MTNSPPLFDPHRLTSLMDRDGFDAIVVRSGQNVTYLSGVVYPGTLGRLLDLTDANRGILVIWPRTGEPAIIANGIALGLTRRDSWIKRIEIHQGYVESPYDKACDILSEMGLTGGTIGFEKGYVSARDWAMVETQLPDMTLRDCTATMDEVRWIKTEAEIALIERNANLLDAAFLDMFARIRVGDSERHAHALLIGACLERGAGWAHGILNASPNTIPYAGEGDTVFGVGDAMRTDYVAYWDGYPGHQSRSLVFGEMTDEQRREYDLNRSIYIDTIDKCRPGVAAGEIYDFALAEFQKAGWPYESLLVGHGVGPWWHQQEPILAKGSEILLEEGMVLAIEPHRRHWHLQDMILVTDGAPKLLSAKIQTRIPQVTR